MRGLRELGFWMLSVPKKDVSGLRLHGLLQEEAAAAVLRKEEDRVIDCHDPAKSASLNITWLCEERSLERRLEAATVNAREREREQIYHLFGKSTGQPRGLLACHARLAPKLCGLPRTRAALLFC